MSDNQLNGFKIQALKDIQHVKGCLERAAEELVQTRGFIPLSSESKTRQLISRLHKEINAALISLSREEKHYQDL